MNLNPFIDYNEDRECTTDDGEELKPISREEAETQEENLAYAMVEDEPSISDFEQAVELRDLFEDEFRVKFRELGMNPDLKLGRTLQYESESPVVFIAMSDIAFGFRREFEYFFRRVGQEIERGKQKRL